MEQSVTQDSTKRIVIIYNAYIAPYHYTQSAQTWITQFYLRITPCLPFVSQAFTRWRHSQVRWKASDGGLLFIYRPRRDERLSWPGWLTYSGWHTHISGHPSATGRAQDREVRLAGEKTDVIGPVSYIRISLCYFYFRWKEICCLQIYNRLI